MGLEVIFARRRWFFRGDETILRGKAREDREESVGKGNEITFCISKAFEFRT